METELSALTQLGLLRSPSLDTITQHIDPAWIEQALQQTGTLSIRHRRLPAQQVVWLILGMALFADRSIASVMSHLRLYGKNPGTPMDQPMTRKKRNVRYRVVKTLGPGDQLVVLSRPKGLSPKRPSQLVARAIHYHWPGYSPQTLLTSLLSAEHFPAAELIAHYHQRWEAKVSLDEVKTHLLVGQGTQLRSRSPERVRQEA